MADRPGGTAERPAPRSAGAAAGGAQPHPADTLRAPGTAAAACCRTRAATARRYIRLADAAQWSPALTAERLFVPLSTPPEQLRQLREAVGGALGVEIPRGLFGTEEAVRTALRQAAGCGATAALCGNIGALPLARAAGLTAVGGFGLNIFNRDAAEFYRTAGLAEATLSMELTFAQLSALLPVSLPAGLLIYGRQPLMLTRNCPRRAALGGCAGCHGQGITDRTGTAFPVMCSGRLQRGAEQCAPVLGGSPRGYPAGGFPPVPFHHRNGCRSSRRTGSLPPRRPAIDRHHPRALPPRCAINPTR